MMASFDIRAAARVLGGDVSGNQALVPGPGHSQVDRSLSLRAAPDAPGEFVVHSFAGDDPIICKDYVRQKLGMPPWQPKRSNGNGVRTISKPVAANTFEDAPAIPAWTQPGDDGKPNFFGWGDDGPPESDTELRRHIYRGENGLAVRIKVKMGGSQDFINWYRVRNSDGVIGWQAKKPEAYRDVPYIGAIDPFDPELVSDEIFWPEGEKDCETLGKINIPAFTFGGCGDGLPASAATYLRGRRIVILPIMTSLAEIMLRRKPRLRRRLAQHRSRLCISRSCRNIMTLAIFWPKAVQPMI